MRLKSMKERKKVIKVGDENCKPKKVTIELDPDEIVLRTSQASASKEWYLKALLSLILGDLDSAENYLVLLHYLVRSLMGV